MPGAKSQIGLGYDHLILWSLLRWVEPGWHVGSMQKKNGLVDLETAPSHVLQVSTFRRKSKSVWMFERLLFNDIRKHESVKHQKNDLLYIYVYIYAHIWFHVELNLKNQSRKQKPATISPRRCIRRSISSLSLWMRRMQGLLSGKLVIRMFDIFWTNRTVLIEWRSQLFPPQKKTLCSPWPQVVLILFEWSSHYFQKNKLFIVCFKTVPCRPGARSFADWLGTTVRLGFALPSGGMICQLESMHEGSIFQNIRFLNHKTFCYTDISKTNSFLIQDSFCISKKMSEILCVP